MRPEWMTIDRFPQYDKMTALKWWAGALTLCAAFVAGVYTLNDPHKKRRLAQRELPAGWREADLVRDDARVPAALNEGPRGSESQRIGYE